MCLPCRALNGDRCVGCQDSLGMRGLPACGLPKSWETSHLLCTGLLGTVSRGQPDGGYPTFGYFGHIIQLRLPVTSKQACEALTSCCEDMRQRETPCLAAKHCFSFCQPCARIMTASPGRLRHLTHLVCHNTPSHGIIPAQLPWRHGLCQCRAAHTHTRSRRPALTAPL